MTISPSQYSCVQTGPGRVLAKRLSTLSERYTLSVAGLQTLQVRCQGSSTSVRHTAPTGTPAMRQSKLTAKCGHPDSILLLLLQTSYCCIMHCLPSQKLTC